MKFYKLAALVAAMTTASVGASDLRAQVLSEQTRDESGAVTLQFTVSKWVEFISHSPQTYNLASNLAPVSGGGIGGPGYMYAPDGTVMREFRANTPYALSISGLTSESKLRFVGAAGDEVLVDAGCRTWDSSLVQSDQPYYDWNCLGGHAFQPKSHTQWASLRLTLAQAPFTTAGVYSATVYFVIEAI